MYYVCTLISRMMEQFYTRVGVHTQARACTHTLLCSMFILQETSKPIMCCYKLVTYEFIWWGLQDRVESLIQKVCTYTRIHMSLMLFRGVFLGDHNNL